MDIEALVKKHVRLYRAGAHYSVRVAMRAALLELDEGHKLRATEFNRVLHDGCIAGERFKCDAAKVLRDEMERACTFDTEDFGFAQELAMQYGASTVDDDAEIFVITSRDLYVLMRTLGFGKN